MYVFKPFLLEGYLSLSGKTVWFEGVSLRCGCETPSGIGCNMLLLHASRIFSL